MQSFNSIKKSILLLFVSLAIMTFSCREKKDKDFDFIQDHLINTGYHGQFERPEGAFQKAALNLLGVDDVLAYRNDGSSFAIVKIKPGKEEDIFERLAPVLSLVEQYLNEQDRKEIPKSLNALKENSLQHNNILLFWETDKPKDVEKLIKRYF
jgi:hypothetical protein